MVDFTLTTNKKIIKPNAGTYPNLWATPVNSDWDIIDRSLGATQVLTPGATTLVVLTDTQYQAPILVIGASISSPTALTNNVNYQIPSGIGGVWQVYNNTTGAFTITISNGGGGNSVQPPQGSVSIIYSDGTNIRTSYAPAAVTAAGSNTQIQYNSTGLLGASSNFTWDGTVMTVNGNISTGGTVSVNTNGVTGGGALSVRKGGDLLLYNAADTGSTNLYCDTNDVLQTRGSFIAGTSVKASTTGFIFPDNTVQATAFAALLFGRQVFPSGLIMQWGTSSVNGVSRQSVTFNSAFPTGCVAVFTQPLASTIYSPGPSSLNVDTATLSTTQFDALNNNSYVVGFYWFAIGY